MTCRSQAHARLVAGTTSGRLRFPQVGDDQYGSTLPPEAGGTLGGVTEVVNTHHPPSEDNLLVLLAARHPRWKDDREGWVSLEQCGVAWRVHYRHGELLEVGWWGALAHTQSSAPGRRPHGLGGCYETLERRRRRLRM